MKDFGADELELDLETPEVPIPDTQAGKMILKILEKWE